MSKLIDERRDQVRHLSAELQQTSDPHRPLGRIFRFIMTDLGAALDIADKISRMDPSTEPHVEELVNHLFAIAGQAHLGNSYARKGTLPYRDPAHGPD